MDLSTKLTEKACVSNTMKIIGAKWTVMILRELCEEKRRFGEIQKSLVGISPRTLSTRLQELEKHQIINKKIFKEIPLHVEYSLTTKGQSLKEIIQKMHEWGAKTNNSA